uniref:Uncharacterized protein n=1 Tax=Ditylenchus dipsaci TaxID=166011 RepID=A0A915CZW5_9BILA
MKMMFAQVKAEQLLLQPHSVVQSKSTPALRLHNQARVDKTGKWFKDMDPSVSVKYARADAINVHMTEMRAKLSSEMVVLMNTTERNLRSGEISIDNFGPDGRPKSSDGPSTQANGYALNKGHNSDYDLKQNAIDTKQRFVTSAAFKKRGQNSQIQFGRGEAPVLTTTYANSTDQMSNQKYERAQPIRPSNKSEIFASGGNNSGISVNRSEYGEKRAERQMPKRPQTSDLWKNTGKIDSTSVSKSEYVAKQGDRYEVNRRAREGGVFEPNSNGTALYRETSNLSDYGPKIAERNQATRPTDSNIFKNGGAFDSTTVNRSEYSGKKGDRYEAKKHASSDIWKTDGPLESSTVNRNDYSHTKGDRYEMKKNRDSDLLKNSGAFARESTNMSEYQAKKGERNPIKRPETSEIWKMNGKVESSTVNKHDYAGAANAGRGERYQSKRPPTSDLWKKEGQMESTTINRQDYSHTKGERFEARRPQDSNLLKEGTGICCGQAKNSELFDTDTANLGPSSTISQQEYVVKKGERAEYQAKKGDRYDLERPQASEMWKKEGTMDSISVNRAEYGEKKGERPVIRVPKDSGILNSEGKFEGETVSSQEYQSKLGERHEAKKHGSSDIWKTDGVMDATSVHRQDFAHKEGDRYQTTRPQDSDIFKSDSKFDNETHASMEFRPKKAERYDSKRAEDSTIWKREGLMDQNTVSMDEYTQKVAEHSDLYHPLNSLHVGVGASEGVSVSHGDFQQKQGDRYSPIRGAHRSDLTIGDSDALFMSRSMTQDDFGMKNVERMQPIRHDSQLRVDPNVYHSVYHEHFQSSPGVYSEHTKAVRPSTALRLGGDLDMTTGYQMDFHNKMEPCVAGELIESVKKNHANTAHFDFEKETARGHHYYKPKEETAA